MHKQQLDSIKGVFFGQAIGDALGLGTEFLSVKQIQEYYPEGIVSYSQIIQDKHRVRWKIGAWTDDTDQFLCIVDAVLINESLTEHNFAAELYKWFQGKPMGIGNTVLKVIKLPQFTLFPHKAAELVWKISKKKVASNGALMRTSILGCWEFWDEIKVKNNTENICKVTHYDPRCVGSCVIVTSIISNLLRTNKLLSKDEIITIGDNYDSRIKEYIELAYSSSPENLFLDESNSIGYTLKALSAGLWAYFNAKNFEEGLLTIVKQGGDADTNAAIACSLLGAKFGYNKIPDKYIHELYQSDFLLDKFNRFIVQIERKIPLK